MGSEEYPPDGRDFAAWFLPAGIAQNIGGGANGGSSMSGIYHTLRFKGLYPKDLPTVASVAAAFNPYMCVSRAQI